jgi:uncharacterized FAD-dependent dehydrogenase
MPLRLSEIRLSLSEEESTLLEKAAAILKIPKEKASSLRIVKKSLDARKRDRITFVYTIELETEEESKLFQKLGDPRVKLTEKEVPPSFPKLKTELRPVIVGTGPAGLFAALRLAEYGIRSLIRILQLGRRCTQINADKTNI